MKLPTISGIIKRRILVNYRVDPTVVQPLLPPTFRPKLHDGSAIVGICLIRLEEMRPKGAPNFLGMASENAAHRFAVTWQGENGKSQEGVYINRRDTDSLISQIAGGKAFPGEYHPATFKVRDDGDRVDFEMNSKDEAVKIQVRGATSNQLPAASGFKNATEASDFFEAGSLGYSATQRGDKLEGMRLQTLQWKVEPLDVQHVHSSFFNDETKFPAGSIAFDCALIMRNIRHDWLSEPDLHTGSRA